MMFSTFRRLSLSQESEKEAWTLAHDTVSELEIRLAEALQNLHDQTLHVRDIEARAHEAESRSETAETALARDAAQVRSRFSAGRAQ